MSQDQNATSTSAAALIKGNRKLKIGMVGIASFGEYRRERLREAGCFEMIALCDRNEKALTQACSEEDARGVNNFDELLSDPQIEGIVISTGIDTHAPFAIKAMQAGKHVFVEKPLCGTPDEIEQLVKTRDETGRVFGTGHSDNHVDPFAALVLQMIEEDKLGTVVAYEENSSHSGGLEIKPGDWRGLPDRNPGGMLMQCGVHAIHRINHMFGEIFGVSCMMRHDAHPDTKTADVANVLIRHKSGLVGTLNCYHVTGYCHELRVFGTKGNLYIDTHSKQAWYQQRRNLELEEREPIELPQSGALDNCSNVINWYKAIVEGGEPRPSLEDGIAAVAPVFAAQQSADERREVPLRSRPS